MAKLTNKWNLPEIILDAARSSKYTRGEADISATQLIDSPRVVALRDQHEGDQEFDVSDRVWALFGRAVHALFEPVAKDYQISEERIFAECNDWIVSGQIDLQDLDESGIYIRDWKTVSVWTLIFGNHTWEEQINVYAWLVEKTKGRPVVGCSVIAIIRDWVRRRAATEDDYPKSPIIEIEIPLWSMEDRQAYVEERIRLHQDAQLDVMTGHLARCTDADRWMSETTYAVVKKGNQRATKVCATMAEAMAAIEDLTSKAKKGVHYEIEPRPGEAARCSGDYCGVSKWCDQWQSEIEGEGSG